ncbi:TetR family transcriptional regulator C-terminal domain-containing protein [Cryomorphaceae bacterium 1068]|nr:TetR family transcriptional regulator C-terminal domain-containing protein [Cryomorphaceae bacterium 1068]
MATKTRTTKAKITPKHIIDAYLKYVLTEGKQPPSVFKFADDLGIGEADFYSHFTSFESIEKHIWEDLMAETLKAIEKDSNYESFNAREKLLSFYYTHLEVMKGRRSFIMMRWTGLKEVMKTPDSLKSYKEHFLKFAKRVIVEGINGDEIKERSFISDRYDQAFWLQLVFVIDFWVKDTSADFEQTDAAIEKAVNLSFELLSESTLDRAVDFVKFLWQTK